MFVIALSTSGEVGVDIEARKRSIDPDKLSSFLLSSKERERMEQLPENRRRGLITHWVLKESVAKALGTGLSEPVDELEIEFIDGDPVIQKVWSWVNPHDWSLKQLNISDEHDCAVTFRTGSLNNSISNVVKIKELK